MLQSRLQETATSNACTAGATNRFTAAGVAVTALISAHARADVAAAPGGEQPALPSVEVTGTAIHTEADISQSVDTIDKKELAEQHLTLLQDALRNVPGVTLNSGEGGAHGDSVNLRGLSIPDSFFLDGVRDIGQYQRDTFNSEAISVLLGPASAVFGRGSTSGVINSISKQPLLTTLAASGVSAGQADWWRGTADFNLPLSDTAAARLTVMDQRNGVVQRDQVLYRRYGVAPTLAFGIDTPTRLTLSYFKEEENNLPDYGIPFVDGAPAHVDRSNYYSLANYDRTRTNTDIGTIRFEHDFSDSLTLSDSLRYANYGFEYLVTGPFQGNDFVEPPPPGTPYADIDISRDQPSSAGATSLLINRTDATTKFDAGGFANALDSLALGPNWDVDAGLRWDRFKSSFSEVFSGTGFERTDTFLSPRAAVIYKPDAAQSYYLSYGTSQNPVIEYLIVAPSDESLSPEKNDTLELGGKIKLFNGGAQLTGALFDTRVYNARISDPNDPTVQQAPFDQHVQGLELGINGYVTDIFEVNANYTHLKDKITETTDPLSLGKYAPNTPHDAVNVWTTLEPTPAWTVGAGFTGVSHRYADTENTAGVPGYVVFNAMTSYSVNDHLKLQLNLNNVTDKLYFTSIYYVGIAENHALPAAGRTLIGTANYRF